MKRRREQKGRDDYKIVISDLGISPFSVIKAAFALMGVIPILILFYIIIGKNFFNNLLLGKNGFIAAAAVLVSIAGFFYAYNLIKGMVGRLLLYSSERKRADDEKTEVVMAVSHDLKTPLTAIKAAIHNILDGIVGPINKIQTEVVQSCLKSVNKLISFINDVLDISQIQFVRTNLKREYLNFEKVVKNEVSGISELARKNNQKLECKILTKDSNLWGDNLKLSRVIMNLLSNAIKYTPAEGKIDVVLSGDEDTVKLAVINTGPGISPDELGKIFNKYTKLKRDSEGEGIGLGLSIVKDIVDLHKGLLTAKSELGKETEFNIVLPRDLRAKRRES